MPGEGAFKCVKSLAEVSRFESLGSLIVGTSKTKMDQILRTYLVTYNI